MGCRSTYRAPRDLNTLLNQNIQPIFRPLFHHHPRVLAPLLQRPILIHVHPKKPIPLHRAKHHPHTILVLRPPELLLIHGEVGVRSMQVREIRLAPLRHVGEEDEEAGGPVAEFTLGVGFGFEQVVPVERVLLTLLGAADLQQFEALGGNEANERVGAADDAVGDFIGLVFKNSVAGGAPSEFLFGVCNFWNICPIGADWN